MKNLLNLGKALNKAEQKEVNGGRKSGKGPCGGTGGEIIDSSRCLHGEYGTQWYNGHCYACY